MLDVAMLPGFLFACSCFPCFVTLKYLHLHQPLALASLALAPLAVASLALASLALASLALASLALYC
jgi:hypothetical protein